MLRFACMLVMVCVATCGFQAQTGAPYSEREKDVYAIYSLMMTNPGTSHGADDNERYLIAATTAPGQPRDPCVRPPKERETEFREVLADFERRKETQRQLRPLLSIAKPYELLDDDDVRAFIEERRVKLVPRSKSERFRGVSDLFRLSDVYFNQAGTLALTALSSWCGGLCGQWEWRVFEKVNTGKWEERRWTACFTIASDRRRT